MSTDSATRMLGLQAYTTMSKKHFTLNESVGLRLSPGTAKGRESQPYYLGILSYVDRVTVKIFS